MSPNSTLHLDTFLPYMRDVLRCEQALQELNMMWRLIESGAKMNCPEEAKAILPTMAATRLGFNRLELELVASLVQEKVSNVQKEIGTQAHYIIDILIRNLYERTADVGFLATDNELAEFVAGETDNVKAIQQRLKDYRNKYTVYDDILLLSPSGQVLAQVDTRYPLEFSSDPLIAETLRSDSYVETFRFSDLRPGKRRALIYSRKILHPRTRNVVGLLCLCFNFEEEMAGIFRSHGDRLGRSVMLLVNAENQVIESSNPLWIPLDVEVPVDDDSTMALQTFAGREYLIRTFKTAGYQGYMGPEGWRGQVMTPVDIAFSGVKEDKLSQLPQHIREGVLSHAKTFSPPLFEIINAADNIRSVVWNGQVMSAGQVGDQAKLKAVLTQISETANRSNELFSKSIGDLYGTVLTSGLKKAEFMSHLLVDLLDRNLYERADDCRWWALTPELRMIMSGASIDAASRTRLCEILKYINSLYTVYTRLVIYNMDGEIVASTLLGNDDPETLGTFIDPHTVAQVRQLNSDQSYYVTPFESSALYEGAPTYVYHAAIHSDQGAKRVVGGVGIVFNSAVELEMMLRGGMGNASAMSGFYTDRTGRIISSSDSSRPVGSRLPLELEVQQLSAGKKMSRIVEHDGNYAVMGCCASSGYREFKSSDGYKEDVLAIVFEPIGPVRQQMASATRAATTIAPEIVLGERTEYATFISNGVLFALPAAHVMEAVSASRLATVPMGAHKSRVGLLDMRHKGESAKPVWVFDLNRLLQKQGSDSPNDSQIIVLEKSGRSLGLLVDELHDVQEFSDRQIMRSPFFANQETALVHQLIKANQGALLIQSLCVDSLFNKSIGPNSNPIYLE